VVRGEARVRVPTHLQGPVWFEPPSNTKEGSIQAFLSWVSRVEQTGGMA
jgi:hypothetical protein